MTTTRRLLLACTAAVLALGALPALAEDYAAPKPLKP
jgi:hypothetical protein